MKLAIMQPYFFPYLGYYQLVNLVDKFMFLDDVNYKKGGWINRNRFLTPGGAKYFTIPINSPSLTTKINEITIADQLPWKSKILNQISTAYKNAPYFDEIFDLVGRVVNSDSDRLSPIAMNSISMVFDYLDMDRKFAISSGRGNPLGLKGVDRVIDICKDESADVYINAPGGSGLYHPLIFVDNNIELRFLNVDLSEYPQFSGDFCPGLSMVDVMMFNSPNAIRQMLDAVSA